MSSLKEKACHKLRDAITYGEFKPGERIVEVEICDKLDIGRTPLREALCQLQMEGYVDLLPNKGAIISKYSISDVESIWNIIAVLERYATELAIQYIGKTERKELKAIQEAIEKAWLKSDYKNGLEQNDLFHAYFVRLTGNHHLASLVNSLRGRIHRYGFISITLPGHTEKHLRSHNEILDFAFKGKTTLAGKAMQRHLLFCKEDLVKFLKQSPGF
jgi:DNA-binding GntR family transcriptional regulator